MDGISVIPCHKLLSFKIVKFDYHKNVDKSHFPFNIYMVITFKTSRVGISKTVKHRVTKIRKMLDIFMPLNFMERNSGYFE